MTIKEYEKIQRGFHRLCGKPSTSIKQDLLTMLKHDLEFSVRKNGYGSIKEKVLELEGYILMEIKITVGELRLAEKGIK